MQDKPKERQLSFFDDDETEEQSDEVERLQKNLELLQANNIKQQEQQKEEVRCFLEETLKKRGLSIYNDAIKNDDEIAKELIITIWQYREKLFYSYQELKEVLTNRIKFEEATQEQVKQLYTSVKKNLLNKQLEADIYNNIEALNKINLDKDDITYNVCKQVFLFDFIDDIANVEIKDIYDLTIGELIKWQAERENLKLNEIQINYLRTKANLSLIENAIDVYNNRIKELQDNLNDLDDEASILYRVNNIIIGLQKEIRSNVKKIAKVKQDRATNLLMQIPSYIKKDNSYMLANSKDFSLVENSQAIILKYNNDNKEFLTIPKQTTSFRNENEIINISDILGKYSDTLKALFIIIRDELERPNRNIEENIILHINDDLLYRLELPKDPHSTQTIINLLHTLSTIKLSYIMYREDGKRETTSHDQILRFKIIDSGSEHKIIGFEININEYFKTRFFDNTNAYLTTKKKASINEVLALESLGNMFDANIGKNKLTITDRQLAENNNNQTKKLNDAKHYSEYANAYHNQLGQSEVIHDIYSHQEFITTNEKGKKEYGYIWTRNEDPIKTASNNRTFMQSEIIDAIKDLISIEAEQKDFIRSNNLLQRETNIIELRQLASEYEAKEQYKRDERAKAKKKEQQEQPQRSEEYIRKIADANCYLQIVATKYIEALKKHKSNFRLSDETIITGLEKFNVNKYHHIRQLFTNDKKEINKTLLDKVCDISKKTYKKEKLNELSNKEFLDILTIATELKKDDDKKLAEMMNEENKLTEKQQKLLDKFYNNIK